MTDYEWLTEMNLCHRCRKNKPAPNKKFCFDCLDKIRKENRKRYDSEKAKQYQKRRKELYEERKAVGICVRCKKKQRMDCTAMSTVYRKREKDS